MFKKVRLLSPLTTQPEQVQEVLDTKCAKCTDSQKEIGKQLISAIREKHADLWEKLVAKYDPEGKYQKEFSELLEN
ncbi:hypothetical protein EVAR_77992_1 [Eumeta japonica]|uniref:Chemosensory protein n=1 Tax=Eumeta variegata TaxID=151549 RepID=A0A4C1T3G5_EUMVA|nr:hypothetical protein EVAR_77992_1 [Eumeta japonica]